MTPADVRRLAASGWEIASHSLFHCRLSQLPPNYADELADWKRAEEGNIWSARCTWRDVGTVICDGRYLRRLKTAQQVRACASGFFLAPESSEIFVKVENDEIG